MARKTSSRTSSSSSKSSKNSRGRGNNRSASAIYGDVLGIAGSLFRPRQEAGAEKIGTFADAARNFASDMTDIPYVQTYVSAAADQMEMLSEYVVDNDLEQMVEDAAGLAKRHPVATAAFAVAAGFGFYRMMTHNNGATNGIGRGRKAPSARSGAVKSASSKKRGTTRAKSNGRASPVEGANAS